jgi:predicted amino acid-binding ACT domain protein
MSEIVLINVTGEDRPGITAALTAILARYQVPILDIGQSTIHNALALGLMVELPRYRYRLWGFQGTAVQRPHSGTRYPLHAHRRR